MSNALNLIIARGFPELGTAVQDGFNRQRQANNQSAESQTGQAINEFKLGAAQQEQTYQAQDRAAAQKDAAELNQLLQGVAEVDARLRQNPNDPDARRAAVELATRIEAIQKGGSKSVAGILGLEQKQAGSGFGNVNPGDYTPESLARYAQTGNYADLRRQYAPPGQVLVNTPGFGVGIVDKGDPSRQTMLTTPEQEAAARSAAAASQADAKETAKVRAAAVADLPRVEANAQDTLSVLNQLKSAPGLSMIYGPASLAPIVPGTKQADAFALWEQMQGKAFLEAFGTLKGGGQITEVEGQKATAAITRLANRRTSPKAAVAAMNEFEGVIKRGVERARSKANAGGAPAAGSQPRAIQSDADYDALPSGATFIAPDGSVRKKP